MAGSYKTDIVLNGIQISVASNIRHHNDDWVVFLHGLQSSKALFSDVLERAFFQKYALLLVDFVGFGDSTSSHGFAYDLKDQAQVITALLDKIGIKKCHIVGHSLGGMVGTILLNAIPDRILSFISLEGNLCFEDCGASREIAMHPIQSGMSEAYYLTACSIVTWSKSNVLKNFWNDSDHKKILFVGKESGFASREYAGVAISDAGHFMLIDNPEETYDRIEWFIASKACNDGIG